LSSSVAGNSIVQIEKIRSEGLSIKLDTNGSNPAMLGQIIQAGLIDSVAMDVKAPFAKYTTLSGVNASHTAISESIRGIVESGLVYEFRTTVVPHLLNEDDIAAIRKMLPTGAVYRLQAYRPPPQTQ